MKYQIVDRVSERLSFRLLEDDDFNDWLALFRNYNAARFLGMQLIATPKERCQIWFEKTRERYRSNRGVMHVLEHKENKAFIGMSGLLLQEVDGEEHLEVAYSILPEYWGQGYATEAARFCRDYAFENQMADSLISIVHPENNGSAKVARKNGMRIWKRTTFKHFPVRIFRIELAEWMQIQGS